MSSFKIALIYTVLALGVIGLIFILFIGSWFFITETSNGDLNRFLFKEHSLETNQEKIDILLKLGLYVSLYLFGLAVAVMNLRIFTGKSSPATQTDSFAITTLNRIITNTIEQFIIFIGLYANILFNGKGIIIFYHRQWSTF
jgi:hypothetical protein